MPVVLIAAPLPGARQRSGHDQQRGHDRHPGGRGNPRRRGQRYVDALCRRVTDDVRFQFGNAEVTTGISAFEAASRAFFQSIAAIRHELLDLWEVKGGPVIATMTVHYERLDGQKLSLPCCNLFSTRDGRVYDYRVYMDINPVFAA